MANVDNPRGFHPAYTETGGAIVNKRFYSDGSAAIYPGDPVKKDGSGRVLSVTASTDNPMGVATTYAAATAGTEVYVCNDFYNTVFECQSDDATLADSTANGNFFDLTVTTGNTTTLRSQMELDGNASSRDTLTLIDIVERPDNAWGANVDIYVKFRVDTQAVVIANT